LLAGLLTGCTKEKNTTTQSQQTFIQSAKPAPPPPPPSILEWQLCLGTKSDDYGRVVAKADDGGYFVAGTTGIGDAQDGYLVKLDANHKVVGSPVIFVGSKAETINGIVTTDDGGCLIAGSTGSPEVQGYLQEYKADGTPLYYNDVMLAKFDKDGNKQWIKAIGRHSSQAAEAIIKTSDGNFAISGYSDQLLFMKIDNQANVLMESYYSWSSISTDFGYSLIQTTDGYIIAGHTITSGGTESGLLVVKVFNDGTTTGYRYLSGSSDVFAWDVVPNATGTEFVLTGRRNGDLLVVRLDPQLNMIASKTFGGKGFDQGKSIISTGQGYIIVGTSDSNNGDISNPKGGSDIWVLQVDNNLNKISSNNLGGNRDDSDNSVIADSDGGYVAIGSTNSTGGDVSGNHGGNDIWVVKFKFPPTN
jgi:hypothetical protein